MKIRLNSITVKDQDVALAFYTEVLPFKKKMDIPMGEYRWLTVVGADNDDVELLLEPAGFAPAAEYQRALFDADIAATAFEVDDIKAVHEQLKTKGVRFKTDPTEAGSVSYAMFDDTCGNKIQILEIL